MNGLLFQIIVDFYFISLCGDKISLKVEWSGVESHSSHGRDERISDECRKVPVSFIPITNGATQTECCWANANF